MASRNRSASLLGLLVLALPACSTLGDIHDFFLGGPPEAAQVQRLSGFIGGVAADEPRAALAARDELAVGGNAADAATVLGFTLAVTLPSRAGLGAGGACLVYNPAAHVTDGPRRPDAVMFTPIAPAQVPASSDRPAAVPMLARGLFLLHARYGSKPFDSLIIQAEQLAHLGTTVSRALALDLSQVAGPLLADPNARAVFGAASGGALGEGAQLMQPDLGATLAQLRVSGVGDLYQGVMAHRLADASALAGGALSVSDLHDALPHIATPLSVPAGNDIVAFTPPPADGGLGAAAAFRALTENPGDSAGAAARALGAVSAWRSGGVRDPASLIAAPQAAGPLPPLPASTGFVVVDRNGMAVTCTVTMDNLFGTGRVVPGMGILLAASPAGGRLPLLASALAYNANLDAFRAAVAGTGQEAASFAAASGMAQLLRQSGTAKVSVAEPGRVEAIGCGRYLPGNADTCAWSTDAKGAGLAMGGN